jgi:chromosome segregation ATPase
MNDIERYKAQVKRAEDANRRIASLEGSRDEVIRQLNELGVSPDTLDTRIAELEREIAELEAVIKRETDKLRVAVDEVERVLNE